jgi:hypothetical protein
MLEKAALVPIDNMDHSRHIKLIITHLMYIGPCIVVIFNAMKNQLDTA